MAKGKKQAMIYRSLGKTGLECSILGMGCAHVGKAYAGAPAVTGKAAEKLVAHALQAGITLFDVADDYGQEIREQALDAKTTVCVKTDTWRQPEGGELMIRHHFDLEKATDDSKRWDGVSCYSEDVPHAAYAGFSVIQCPLNLIDRASFRASPFLFRFHRNDDSYGIIVRSVLLRGKLEAMAEQAVRFAAFSGADCALVGFRNRFEVDAAVKAVEKGPIEWEEIIDPRRWDSEQKDVLGIA